MADSIANFIGEIRPEGLVLGSNVLHNKGLYPPHQGGADTAMAADLLGVSAEARPGDDPYFELADPWPLFRDVLGWDARYVAGAPDGPVLPTSLRVSVPEQDALLAPDWAVLYKGDTPEGIPAQALVMLRPDLDADKRGAEEGWEASPHQRLERLVRETGVGIGILVARNALRLIFAPSGETSGWMTWPLAPLARVEGRVLLGGLKLALGRQRFLTGPPDARLLPLLEESRRSQNDVSTKLSEQVLGALHELLRGVQQADPEGTAALAKDAPQHLYEGLLSVLMRLVFLLYAEDRDLMPTSRDPEARALWQSGYAIGTLFSRLEDDAALNPDTMDERRGGWGQLLAVFRLVHDGRGDWVMRRGGKLFDPDQFPFLEGRAQGSRRSEARVLPVSDGCIHRVLENLMTLPAETRDGARERLSYRTLDVEQIGSVYETVIGFVAQLAEEPVLALAGDRGLPIYVGLETLLATKPKDRGKWLADRGVKPSAGQKSAINKAQTIGEIVTACATGQARGHRVGLIDRRGSPDQTPLGAGSAYLQPTEERRSSGSHYTPRELTHPIVGHALDPAFERLGEEATPDEVLALKVCDPACGSGAFLVEACRQIGARLQQAWAKHGRPDVPHDEDEATFARRLVAQKCLYGVDRNPMAVDLCKLSLWLATLADEHEFTFLDHAIRVGDSLVGLTAEEIGRMSWMPPERGEGTFPLLASKVRDEISAYRGARGAIRNAPDDVTRAVQEATLRHARKPLDNLRMVADAIISTFWEGTKIGQRKTALAEFSDAFENHGGVNTWETQARPRAETFQAMQGWQPFHWELEFPEVFEQGGFDAVVGNPPFAGKNTISAASGPLYIPWLQRTHPGAHGNADLAAHFFRRAYDMLREGAAFGLIASNTIAQGDTRTTGLLPIVEAGGGILRATKRLTWPGEAAVMVSVVHVVKGAKPRSPVLDGRQVDRISAWLVPGEYDASPEMLVANKGKAFEGSKLLGMGFTFDDKAAAKGEAESIDEMNRLIARDPCNAERIRPYIGGEEVNTSPTHAHHRYAIDFEDFPLRRDPTKTHPWAELTEESKREMLRDGVVSADYPGPVAADWPDLLEIVERRVKPQRRTDKREVYRRRWWQYAERRVALYPAVQKLSNTLALSRVSPNLAISTITTQAVYADSIDLILFDNLAPFAVLQSRLHEIWARFFSSSMKDDLRYAPSDCFETFPFPFGFETDPILEAAGQAYYDHRAALMVEHKEGMTTTYNRFHDVSEKNAAIATLRSLHAEMDKAVLHAYGWHDLAAEAVFLEKPEDDKGKGYRKGEPERDHTYQGRLHWRSDIRDEVLRRLLKLNGERAAEEAVARERAELEAGGPQTRATARARAAEKDDDA